MARVVRRRQEFISLKNKLCEGSTIENPPSPVPRTEWLFIQSYYHYSSTCRFQRARVDV